MSGHYFFVEDVAKEIRVHPVSVRRLHAQGKIKSHGRSGHRLVFTRENIDDYIRNNGERITIRAKGQA